MHDDRLNELDRLDPERRHPGYWMALQARVLEAAAPELARRRADGGVTVYDLVFAWARALVPAAAAAAIAALALLAADGRAGAGPMAVDDVLQGDVTAETFPMLFAEDLVGDDGAFLAAVEGRPVGRFTGR